MEGDEKSLLHSFFWYNIYLWLTKSFLHLRNNFVLCWTWVFEMPNFPVADNALRKVREAHLSHSYIFALLSHKSQNGPRMKRGKRKKTDLTLVSHIIKGFEEKGGKVGGSIWPAMTWCFFPQSLSSSFWLNLLSCSWFENKSDIAGFCEWSNNVY